MILYVLLGSAVGFTISFNTQINILENYKILDGETSNLRDKVLIQGEILETNKQSDIINSYIFKINKINSKNIYSSINLLINTNTKINFNKGDLIEFSSKISKISNFNDFEYDKFLQLKNIYGQVSVYQFIKNGNNLNYFEKYIYSFRQKILDTIDRIYPGDSSKLLAGIFLGVRGNYSTELKNGFNNSGLSHIVAVSGYNITILIIFFGLFLRGFSGIIKNLFIIFVIVFFLLLIGDNIPALRAGVMGIIGYIATSYGRKINIYSILIFIASFFVAMNPLIINYDISFYLTFLALLGLIVFQEKINKILYFLPNKFQIKESVATTLSVLIFTIPIMLTSFEKISIISPISNLLVLPIIPLSMLFGGLSILTYFIYAKIGIYLGYLTFLFLKFILFVSDTLGNWQYSTINYDLGEYKNIFIIFYYIILLFIVFYFRNNENDGKKEIIN